MSQGHHSNHEPQQRAYLWFAIELLFDFIVMYLVMYAMIATLADFYVNLGNVYMTMMMVAPMALIMLFMMRSMFPSSRANMAIVVLAVVTFAIGYYGMRAQAGIGDRQFLRSMIPHHSGAVLMCREATLTDPEIVELCSKIVAGQEQEIAQMKAILGRL